MKARPQIGGGVAIILAIALFGGGGLAQEKVRPETWKAVEGLLRR